MEKNAFPWTVEESAVLDAGGRNVEVNGFSSVMSPGDRQVAAKKRRDFIVRAANNHDALVKALAEARDRFNRIRRAVYADDMVSLAREGAVKATSALKAVDEDRSALTAARG